MKRKKPKALTTFAALVEKGRDPRAALREVTGLATADLARRAGVSRSQANLTLGLYPGRRSPHVRRAIEATLKWPPYALDHVLDSPAALNAAALRLANKREGYAT